MEFCVFFSEVSKIFLRAGIALVTSKGTTVSTNDWSFFFV